VVCSTPSYPTLSSTPDKAACGFGSSSLQTHKYSQSSPLRHKPVSSLHSTSKPASPIRSNSKSASPLCSNSKPGSCLCSTSKYASSLCSNHHITQSVPSAYYISPPGLVPKKTSGVITGWRRIHSLSAPQGHSVNDGILQFILLVAALHDIELQAE